GSSFMPAVSGDGQLVVFSSQSQFLVPNDTNNVEDVFVHNRQGVVPQATATPSQTPTLTPTPAASLTPTPSPSPSATPSAQPPAEDWQTQTLEVRGRTGLGASLALDEQGLPHISYQALTGFLGHLSYMHWDGVVWQTSIVDDRENTGYDSDIVIDSSGRPQISYRGDLGSLNWALWDGNQWVRELAHGGPSVGYSSAIALHPISQQIHILHINIITGELLHTRRITNGWVTVTVAQNVVPTSRNGLAFDLNGILHATYYDGASLQYATWDGSNWSSQIADSSGNVGLDNSLAFNSGNRPQISYYDIGNHALKYAYFNGTSWQTQFVTAPGEGGRSSSIALDSSDTVFISYYATGNLFLATRNGASFDFELLDDTRDTGEFSSLGLDDNGNAHVAYYDSYFADLKYVTWGPNWEFRPVHPGPDNQEPSLALNEINPGLSYYNFDIVPDEIAYAHWDGSGWPGQHVLANGGGSAHTALRYGSDGQPRLASISAQERSLSYRRWDGSSWQAELVEEVTVGDLGHEISLLLDRNDQPTIVYSRDDGANRRIRLAWYDGASWQFSTNDVSPPLGSSYELAGARSFDGLIYVSYYEMGGGDLRLATWDGASWHDELADDGGGADTGRFPAIAIDIRLIAGELVDVVAIGYYDATNQNINYAFRDTSWHTRAVVFNAGPISSLDLVLGNEAWLTPYIAYTALNDNSLRLTYSADGLQTFPLEIIVADLSAPPDQVSLAFDYAPRLAYRDENGGLQYAFPGSRHHIGAAPGQFQQGYGTALGFDGGGCLDFSRGVNKTTPANAGEGDSPDEIILGGLSALFLRTESGRRYISLYATHVDEMARIAWSDPGLTWAAYRTLQNLMPGLEALVNNQGGDVLVTQTMVDQALDVWQQLAAQASPELAAVINGELAATNNLQDFVDVSFDDWALGVGVLPPGTDTFLPIVRVPADAPPAPESTLPAAPVAALPVTTTSSFLRKQESNTFIKS
ncbi:MAG: hypothetical protein KDE04_16670, partial [Anaerolineales bacterium]|nr:hypothetical protein [Anaerolineales bacterium]